MENSTSLKLKEKTFYGLTIVLSLFIFPLLTSFDEPSNLDIVSMANKESVYYHTCPPFDLVNDEASTPKNTPVEIDILYNDSDIPFDGTLTVTTPSNGTVKINKKGTPGDITDDTVTYTPASGFVGTDCFKYTICDKHGNSFTATVTVRVGQCPVVDVVDDLVSTTKNTPVDIDVLDNDSGIPIDGTITVTQPDNGTVEVNDNGTPNDLTDDSVIYTPGTDFEGTDSFEYTVCDKKGN